MLSERIKQLRKNRKYSQEQLARKLGLTQGAISQWETGATTPAADQLVSLAEVFNMSVDELLEHRNPDIDDPWQLRERLRADPDMRALFSAATKATPEHIRAVTATLKALEPGDSEE